MIQHKGIVILLAAGSLLAAPVAFRPAADSPASVHAANLGQGELIGKVVHTSYKLGKRRVQVLVDGREWTLHVPNGSAVVYANREISVHDLDAGTYVRAIGTRIGDTRLKTTHVYVIGDRLALRKSGYASRNGEDGYFLQYAGYRTRYRR